MNKFALTKKRDKIFPGPNLPFELENSVALTDGDDILLVGGKTKSGKNKDSILRLKRGKWQALRTTLEVARSSHVAMLVPNTFFQC